MPAVAKVFNLHGDDWDRGEDRPGWRSNEAWVGARLGAELIGASMIVVRGRATLRTPEGEQELGEGDVVAFPRDPTGATRSATRPTIPSAC